MICEQGRYVPSLVFVRGIRQWFDRPIVKLALLRYSPQRSGLGYERQYTGDVCAPLASHWLVCGVGTDGLEESDADKVALFGEMIVGDMNRGRIVGPNLGVWYVPPRQNVRIKFADNPASPLKSFSLELHGWEISVADWEAAWSETA